MSLIGLVHTRTATAPDLYPSLMSCERAFILEVIEGGSFSSAGYDPLLALYPFIPSKKEKGLFTHRGSWGGISTAR
jgi:hypothetical protein